MRPDDPFHFGSAAPDPGPDRRLDPPRRAPRAIPLGSIGGIPITIAWSWVLSIVLVTVLGVPVVRQVVPGTSRTAAIAVSVALAILLGLSVLVHELGHCLAARALGVRVTRVRIYLVGGMSELSTLPASPRDEAVIAAAGPAASAVLAAIFGLLIGSVPDGTLAWLLVVLLALSNAVVAAFNLLPALPLDGGRVLRAGVWRLTGGRRTGTLAGVVGGYLIAVGLTVWAAVLLTGSTAAAVLQGGIAAVMAVFVGVGAAREHPGARPPAWPDRVPINRVMRPIVQLPSESPVSWVLTVAAGRTVVLTGVDGVTDGILDEAAGAALARTAPQATAALAARPIAPDTVVLASDDPAEVVERLRMVAAPSLLVVDEHGLPAGVLTREDVTAVLSGRLPADRR